MATPDDTDNAPRLVAEPAPGDNSSAESVGELAHRLKRAVEDGFGRVRVRGEISGYKRAASGHLYLALKDDRAVIDAVVWKGQAAALAFRPQDGVEVVATGRLTTYPGRSRYQIVVDRMELAGQGALMALLERLRVQLAGEGLFDRDRKKALPYLPRVIGVVTSPTGAVIRDILHRLADRCPTHVVVWPVKVQGEGAAAEVAAAVRGFDALPAGPAARPAGGRSPFDGAPDMGGGGSDPVTSDGPGGPPAGRGGSTAAAALPPRPDLLIVARGGGSVEDLWAFNEEAVVRAVAECGIPVISAVGHETDTTLCDHAADLRAPTPTAAAEMAVPVLADLRLGLDTSAARIARLARRYVERGRERLDAQARLLPRRDAILAPQRQRLDDASARLDRGLERRAEAARGRLDRVAGALRPALLDRRLETARARVEGAWRLAVSLSPDRVLERGYARVEDRAGATLATAAAARGAGAVALVFRDGRVDARVERARARAYRTDAPEQPPLL